ncbi:hypothetical protein CIK66_18615 [Brachybacterium alimentarium]|uniref:Uncharacterized protein n=1 Tax=Brachybacterium alimentarium TaxID=47845 RepID=A0A2A3YE83_9MICO|nr:hypothetical protein [Brachybacterium alimentarium]PCC37578.1 hypothetical protein CIK66_18615 [Brachybacterium alimentarium]
MDAEDRITAPEHSPTRRDRCPAQVAVTLGLLFAAVAFFWDSGLPSFLLALFGALVTVLGACLTPDGWLVDPEETA